MCRPLSSAIVAASATPSPIKPAPPSGPSGIAMSGGKVSQLVSSLSPAISAPTLAATTPACWVAIPAMSRSISDSVLSDRLSDLAEAGLIARTVDEGPPLAVSYALTDRGNALIPALAEISLWAQEHLPEDGG